MFSIWISNVLNLLQINLVNIFGYSLAYLCEDCGKRFKYPKNLECHKMSSFHQTEGTYQCPLCPKKFFRKSRLDRHSEFHRGDKYVCEICQTELLSKLSYKGHMSTYFVFPINLKKKFTIAIWLSIQKFTEEPRPIDDSNVCCVHRNFSMQEAWKSINWCTPIKNVKKNKFTSNIKMLSHSFIFVYVIFSISMRILQSIVQI